MRLNDDYIYTPFAIASAIEPLVEGKMKEFDYILQNLRVLECGVQLVEYLMTGLSDFAGKDRSFYNPQILSPGSPFDEEAVLLKDDYDKYKEDLKLCQKVGIQLPEVVNNRKHNREVDGLIWHKIPSCLLHQYWAR